MTGQGWSFHSLSPPTPMAALQKEDDQCHLPNQLAAEEVCAPGLPTSILASARRLSLTPRGGVAVLARHRGMSNTSNDNEQQMTGEREGGKGVMAGCAPIIICFPNLMMTKRGGGGEVPMVRGNGSCRLHFACNNPSRQRQCRPCLLE